MHVADTGEFLVQQLLVHRLRTPGQRFPQVRLLPDPLHHRGTAHGGGSGSRGSQHGPAEEEMVMHFPLVITSNISNGYETTTTTTQ